MTCRMLCAAAVLGAAGFAGYGAAWAAAAAAVTVDNFTFSPGVLTVALDTAVTWTNRDDIPHLIVVGDAGEAVKSPVLDTDEVFTFRFGKVGTYHYFCSMHPQMQGTVIVK